MTAPAGGRVTLVRDLYFAGWTILLTHGLGLNSAFLHLDSVTVAEGDEVARGAMIGTVGSTGRSTGPHLDWRLDWQGRRLDAALVWTQGEDRSCGGQAAWVGRVSFPGRGKAAGRPAPGPGANGGREGKGGGSRGPPTF